MDKKKKRRRSDNSMRAGTITVMTCLTLLLAIMSMLYLSDIQNDITTEYSRIIKTDMKNKENMSYLVEDLYLHQSIIFQYLNTGVSSDEKAELRSRADDIEKKINNDLDTVGDSVTGTRYETYFHSIYSNVNGYFSNIGNVLYFSDNNDNSTAYYYMDSSMVSYIAEVNRYTEEFDELLTADMTESEKSMDSLARHSAASAALSILACSVLSVFSILISSRISKLLVIQDVLTGADNYEKFQRDCEKLSKTDKFSEYTCIFCNIKDFRFYNSRFGDRAGDSVLIEYAASIMNFLNSDEHISRNGGDNFALIIKSKREDQFLSHLSEIKTSIGESTAEISSYCGIYSIQPGDRPGDVFAACNLALSTAKTGKTSNFIRYEKKMFDELTSRKDTLRLCHEGIRNNEFIVYYQPKVDMLTETLCGCEALVRWLHNGKLVPPSEFIGVLESENAINQLDFYVFEKVCRDISEWKSRNIEPVRISSNFSKLHLKDKLFADKILSAVKKYGVDPGYIEVELTESSAYEDFSALSDFVDIMRKNGIHTSMDDFGTGYSSLSLLKNLNVDVIKIDKSFIDDLENGDSAHKKMIENIVRMIHDLDREVICEGIETADQAEFLKKVNCNVAQGYLYDRPLAKEEFEKRLIEPVYKRKS